MAGLGTAHGAFDTSRPTSPNTRKRKLTPATVNRSLEHLVGLTIVREVTKRMRGRVFAYRRYVSLLEAEL